MAAASREIIKIIIAAGQVVGRAFTRAVQQELRASQQTAKNAGGNARQSKKRAMTDTYTGMTLQEAKQILNVPDHTDAEAVKTNYDHLFSVNEKAKGGSFYLQSKVVRAKERIEMEIQSTESASEESSGASQKPVPPDT